MHSQLTKFAGMATALSILSGCGLDTRPSSLPAPGSDAKLSIIRTGAEYGDVIGSNYPNPSNLPILNLDPKKDDAIARICGVDLQQPKKESFVPLLVGFAIDLAIELAIAAAEEELKNYNTAYGDTVSFPNWTRDLQPARNTAFYSETTPLTLSWKCFRLVRGEKDVTGKAIKGIEMDFVGQVALTPNRDALLFRPLRLYYGRPAPEKINEKKGVGLAVSVSMASVWRASSNGVAKSEKLFEHVVLKEKFKPDGKFQGSVKYYDDADATENLSVAPLVPISIGLPPRGQAGYALMTVQAAEVSDPNGVLKWLAKFAKDKKSDIAGILKEAAKAAGIGDE